MVSSHNQTFKLTPKTRIIFANSEKNQPFSPQLNFALCFKMKLQFILFNLILFTNSNIHACASRGDGDLDPIYYPIAFKFISECKDSYCLNRSVARFVMSGALKLPFCYANIEYDKTKLYNKRLHKRVMISNAVCNELVMGKIEKGYLPINKCGAARVIYLNKDKEMLIKEKKRIYTKPPKWQSILMSILSFGSE